MPETVKRYATGNAVDGRGGGRRRGGGGGRRRGGGDALSALLGRAGEMMDFWMEQAQAEGPRKAKAFDYYTQQQESELDDADLRRKMARREATYARQRELAAGKEKRTAATSAREERRAETKAQHDRETALQTRYNPMEAGIYRGVDMASTVSPWTRQKRGF